MKPFITAHTGCMKTKANSLESIRVGAESGADAVEFDVRFLNGVPVLSHNDVDNDKTLITLDEAFSLVSEFPSLSVNVDLKEFSNLKAVKESALKYGLLNRIFFTGASVAEVETLKKNAPGVAFSLNWALTRNKKNNKEYVKKCLEKIKASGARGINIRYVYLSDIIVANCRELDLSVEIWTVNSKLAKKKVLKFSPDVITTKKPYLFL